jgi:ABC-type Fe2+-enterobactin transport system substrate-binding protein
MMCAKKFSIYYMVQKQVEVMQVVAVAPKQQVAVLKEQEVDSNLMRVKVSQQPRLNQLQHQLVVAVNKVDKAMQKAEALASRKDLNNLTKHNRYKFLIFKQKKSALPLFFCFYHKTIIFIAHSKIAFNCL